MPDSGTIINEIGRKISRQLKGGRSDVDGSGRLRSGASVDSAPTNTSTNVNPVNSMSSGDFIKRVSDSAKGFAESFADKAEDALEVLSDKAEDAFDVAKEKGSELKDKAQIAIGDRETPHLNRLKAMYALIGQGKMLEAFDTYYDDDVVMQENSEEPRRGKEVNRGFQTQFMESIEEKHGGGVGAMTSNEKEGVTMVESWIDATFKGGGRMKMQEVAVQKWKGGKVIHERFYYNKG